MLGPSIQAIHTSKHAVSAEGRKACAIYLLAQSGDDISRIPLHFFFLFKKSKSLACTMSGFEQQEGYEMLGGDSRVDSAIAQPIADGKNLCWHGYLTNEKSALTRRSDFAWDCVLSGRCDFMGRKSTQSLATTRR